MTIKCPKCHSDNTDTARFCSNCAAPLPSSEEISVSHTKTLEMPVEELTTGSTFAGRYEIIEELGKGGMGVVYKAEDTKLKRIVALKFLPPTFRADPSTKERFINEAQTASKLDHPNICTIHEIDETDDGQMFIAMAYYEGETLKEKIQHGPLDLSVVLDITTQIAQGLSKAQSKGIVHRDIKPANIIVTEDDVAKIIDFGLAKLSSTARLTRTGTTIGTVNYMSPEQARGEAVDHRTDIWSLGVVFYEMLTGQLPFKGDHEQAVVYSILNKEPEPITSLRTGVPAELEQIVFKALAKNPKDRYHYADELLADLQEVYKILDIKPVWKISAWPRLRRRKWLTSPILWTSLVVLVGIAIGLLLFYPSQAIPFQKRDWILITDFENLTGDEVFDRSLNTALTVSIQQSSYVNVFPRSRVKETLQRMGRETTEKLDEELGKEVALREGIRALVACSISGIGDVYSLSARVVDPNTLVALKTETSQADGKDRVLEAMDDLAGKIRKDLGESLKDIRRQFVRLPKATTSSLEALKKFSDGAWFWKARRFDEAAALWQEAVKLDPNFAWVHASLGGYFYWLNDRPKGEEHFTKALSLIDRLTEREKLWVQSLVEGWRGNRTGAVKHLRIYLSIYPDDRDAWYNIGNDLRYMKQYEEALKSYNKALEMDAFMPGTYINIATCYSLTGRHQQAVDNYLKAFELRPEWITSGNLNHEFGTTYLAMGEIKKAQEIFEKMLSAQDEQKAKGHRSLALLYMYQGKYSDAIDHLKEAILFNKTLNYILSEMRDRLYLATAYRTNGMPESSHKELNAASKLRSKTYIGPWWLQIAGKIYARLGKFEEAKQLLKEVSNKMNEENRDDRAAFNILKGEIELAGGNYEEAVELLEMACKLREDSYVIESLAYAYFMKGDLDQAISNYELLINMKDLGWEAQEYWIKAHYQLGKIYEEKGDVENAIQYYKRFLDLWKDADPGLAEVEDARTRLVRLKSR